MHIVWFIFSGAIYLNYFLSDEFVFTIIVYICREDKNELVVTDET